MGNAADPIESITVWLREAGVDPAARAQAVNALLDDLRRIARAQRRSLSGHETLSTTALVHEAYLKLLGPGRSITANDRHHFLSLAARTMRQILIDDARSKGREKRDAGLVAANESLDGAVDARATAEMLDVDAALSKLERESPRLAQIATFRYFAGYTEAEIGELLDVDERTVRRDWTKAKLWLHQALSGPSP